MDKEDIEYFMKAAIAEGKKALPHCLPNPPVGCVIVKDKKIVARGYTNEPGQDHAEAMALRLLPKELEDLSMFVTLEPCSFQGRTPSCARTIVSRKIKKVYVGILDPHPKNQGAGIAILQQANIEVQLGILASEISSNLNPYLIRTE